MGRGQIVDLTGRTSGRLTVISLHEHRDDWGKALWNCECTCGAKVLIRSDNIQRQTVRSCGCLRTDEARERMTAMWRAARGAAKPG